MNEHPSRDTSQPAAATDAPEIPRHGRVAQDESMTRLVNFLFKGIDFVIIGDGLIAEVIIALQQTADGVGEVLLGHGSHFKDEGIEPAEGVFHGGKDVALLGHEDGERMKISFG